MNKLFLTILCICGFIFLIGYNKTTPINKNQTDEKIDLASLINKTESEKITGHKIQIEIQNGCGLRGVAKLYTNFLRDKGYDVVGYKNAPHFNYDHTELIIHKKDSSNFINEIANILNIDFNFIHYNYSNNFLYEMTVIIGNDYNTLESFNEVSMYYEPF
tara:strand:+ start:1132 stop:1611 length:480 start_codon:yes stop_codon:yes gene_type:complete